PCGFIHRKARMIRRNLEEYAPRLTEIDRVKIFAIHDGRHVVTLASDLGVPFALLRIVRYAPGNVMNHTRPHVATRAVWRANHVHDRAWFTTSNGIPKTVAILLNQPESESRGKQRRCSFISLLGQSRTMEAVNGVLDRNRTCDLSLLRAQRRPCDQFEPQSIWIRKRHDLLLKTFVRTFKLDALLTEPLCPKFQGWLRNRERGHSYLTMPLAPFLCPRPRKESENRPRGALGVAIVEMIGLGIVIVNREFDKSQAENAGIEIQIPLRVARNRRHVMNAENFFTHSVVPLKYQCRT